MIPPLTEGPRKGGRNEVRADFVRPAPPPPFRRKPMMDELKAFADWLRKRTETVKHLTTDQLVEEFRREQKIREEHQADETDASRTSD